MDESKEYIEMCRKAQEIQAVRKYESCSCYADTHKNKQYVSYICVDCDEEYGAESEFSKTAVWLPRQDQLQALLINWGRGQVLAGVIIGLYKFADDNPQYNNSFEQLWLAFVMKEKFRKFWNGFEWLEVR